MKRFIDLRKNADDIGARFAWYDTILDRFEEHSGAMAWNTWQEFKEDYKGDEIERYRQLTPKWVHNDRRHLQGTFRR